MSMWHIKPVLRRPHVCPVCRGKGQVENGFYGESKNASAWVICRTCHGAGVLWSE